MTSPLLTFKHSHFLPVVLLGSLFAFTGLTQANPIPELHSKVREPVLQELMGGCSLRCAFFWDTRAGIPPSLQPVSELCDDDANTAWISPVEGPGEQIDFRLPKHLPPDCRDTPFYGISVANGLIRSLQEFHNYARVKTMTLLVNQTTVARLHLADTWRWQDLNFPDLFLNQGDILALAVEELYPGKTTQRAAITEIILQGAH